MRLLKNKETLKAMQEAHPEREEYPKWCKIEGRLKREVAAVAKAQHQLDLKEFREWFNTQIGIHARTDDTGRVWLLLGNINKGECEYLEYIQSLNQLVEE